ncbi:MAG: Inner membrane transport permease YadH [Chlamydiia bacterium]|nr:Inner membrane transport permease YadH [Chlamydiia bacterium]
MTRFKNYTIGIYGLLVKESYRLMRAPFLFVANPAINPILYMLIFGVGLGRTIQLPLGVDYFSFLFPGIFGSTILKIGFEASSTMIITNKLTNEFQDYRLNPLEPSQIVFGISLGSVVRGFLVGMITLFATLMLSLVSHFHIPVPKHPILLVLLLIVGASCFCYLGIAVGMKGKTFEFVNSVNLFLLAPLFYLGGVFFPPSILPPIWAKLSSFNPIFYFIDSIRYCFLGVSAAPITISLVGIFASTLICYLLAHMSLQKGEDFLLH